MTQAGEIDFSRVDFRCVKCQSGGYAADERLGLEGRDSPHAQRLICLAAGSWSDDVASEHLEELCGLKISDTTIRECAQEHGALANAWLREEPQGVKDFREAAGDVEFTTDGTSVNTVESRPICVSLRPNSMRIGSPSAPAICRSKKFIRLMPNSTASAKRAFLCCSVTMHPFIGSLVGARGYHRRPPRGGQRIVERRRLKVSQRRNEDEMMPG